MTTTLPKAPKDERGRWVGRDCPICGNGTLQYEGDGYWRCNGLADPEDDNKPLIPCEYSRQDGEAADAP